MREIEKISEEIVELEQRLSDCFDDGRLDDVGHYESEIKRLTNRIERLERTERKTKPNNSSFFTLNL